MIVIEFPYKRRVFRGRKRSDVLEVLGPHIETIARAGAQLPRSGRRHGPTLFINENADFQVISAHTPDGFYMRVDHHGQHKFTAYVHPNTRISVATWRRGEWETEILNAHFGVLQ
jgi:hypothetical protein